MSSTIKETFQSAIEKNEKLEQLLFYCTDDIYLEQLKQLDVDFVRGNYSLCLDVAATRGVKSLTILTHLLETNTIPFSRGRSQEVSLFHSTQCLETATILLESILQYMQGYWEMISSESEKIQLEAFAIVYD